MNHVPHVFPFLFSVLTVVALLASNPYQGVRGHNLVVPLSVAVLVTLVIWAVTGLLVCDRLRRSLIVLPMSLPLLTSGYLFGGLRRSEHPPELAASLEVAFLVLTATMGVVILRKLPMHREAGHFLDLFSSLALLVLMPTVVEAFARSEPPGEVTTALPDTTDIDRPDIYLVILDAYSGRESLLQYYGFDNRPFLDSLRDRGFSIPSQQRSNYIRTFLSVGSILNREYVNDLAEESGPEYRDRGRLYNRMEFNRTSVDLKKLGYTFYYVGSSYPPLATNRLADEQYSVTVSTEFERFWARTTVLPAIVALYCHGLEKCKAPSLPFQPETAAETESRLAYLYSLVERPGPKFVLAHLLLPHGPYRFDEECNPRYPRWTIGPESIESDSLAERLYIEQLGCTNLRILELVDSIRSARGDEPIVLLQADHGSGRFPADRPTSLSAARPDQIDERFDTFAAYAGPEGLPDTLAALRTPVNLFRTIFRVLWGVDEPSLDDRTYWSERDRALLLRELSLR